MDCDIHDWNWDMYDEIGCPICYGINEERERIIALLEKEAGTWSEFCTIPIDPEHCQSCYLFYNLIGLVKGDSK